MHIKLVYLFWDKPHLDLFCDAFKPTQTFVIEKKKFLK